MQLHHYINSMQVKMCLAQVQINNKISILSNAWINTNKVINR